MTETNDRSFSEEEDDFVEEMTIMPTTVTAKCFR
tara:strand:+ start:201 stop:302 length:102 start_codon:yes stop_codon:yes gene_type:complete